MGGVIRQPHHMLLWCAHPKLLTVPFSQTSQQLQHIPCLVLKVLTALQMNTGIEITQTVYSYQASGWMAEEMGV